MTENTNSGKFGKLKLGKCPEQANPEKLNELLPKARNIMIIITIEEKDCCRTHTYIHGALSYDDAVHALDTLHKQLEQNLDVIIIPVRLPNQPKTNIAS